MKFRNPKNQSTPEEEKSSNQKKVKETKEVEHERKFLGLFHVTTNRQLVIIGVIAAIVLWLAITAIGLYAFHSETSYSETMTKYVPYPIAFVNNHIIYYYPYLENVNILKKYESSFKNVNFATKSGQQEDKSIRSQVMDSLVQAVIVQDEANKLKLSVSQKELDDSYAQLIKSNGGEKSFEDVLNKYYGLTSYQFEYDIYKERLLQEKVENDFSNDASINQDALKLAEKVLVKVKAGDNFQALAKQYSQDVTASSGGDLGFFARGKMVPEFEKVAFSLKPGQTSGLVQTVYGYEIILVTAVQGNEIHAYHILIKTKDFQTWLNDSVNSASKHYLISL